MRTRILTISQVILFTLLFSISLFSQQSSFNLNRRIQLTGESKTYEVFTLVERSQKHLGIIVSSSIVKGDLTIEIYNPQKQKIGNYSVGTQIENSQSNENHSLDRPKETVSGQIAKTIIQPLLGKYMIKIIPKNCFGDVNISVSSTESN